MLILAHLSDLHFGRENPLVLEGLLESLAIISPQIVVISGDLTQRARTREFKAARALLARFAWPYLIIPGNHDISASNFFERAVSPWRKWDLHIGKEHEPIVETDDFIALGVNTCRRLGTLFDWSRGRINIMQSKRVAQYLLKEKSERLRIIVAHHPFWLPEPYLHRNLVGGRDQAIHEFGRAGGDIILSGHIHYAYTHVLYGIIISHAGTAVSTRLAPDSPNSFKVVRGNRRSLTVETLAWNGSTFTRYADQNFERGESGWYEV